MSEYLNELDQKQRQAATIIHPIKWYKFLIYFSLFIGALSSLVSGIQYLSGRIYLTQGLTESDIQALYLYYPAHKTLDLIYGLICCSLSGFALFTRSRLAKYHRNGPMCLYLFTGATAYCASMYTLLSCILVYADVTQFLPQIIGQIIGSAIYIWLNCIYFNKRKSLFTNN